MNTANGAVQPKIARIWRGRTTAAKADEYERYLLDVDFRPLVEKALAAELFREDGEGECERDEELLIELPEAVQVLEIVASVRPTISPSE